MQGDRVIGALIGLAGAVSNSGKTERTDEIVREAFLQRKCAEKEDELIAEIRREKYTISPNCETCPNPCGNTSEYDMVKFYEADADVVEAKEQLILAMERKLSQQEEVPELIYHGISFLGYDLEWEAYERLTAELKNGK